MDSTNFPVRDSSTGFADPDLVVGVNEAKTALGLPAVPTSAASLTSGILPDARMPNLTGDVTTSEGAVATTLATVNSNVGSFTLASVTVNGKGLVTAAASAAAADVAQTVWAGLATATAAQLADKTHAINTANKVKGKMVYVTDQDLIYFAIGTTDTSKWRLTGAVDATGDVTPS